MLSTLSVLILVYGIIAFWVMFEQSFSKKALNAIVYGALWLPLLIISTMRALYEYTKNQYTV